MDFSQRFVGALVCVISLSTVAVPETQAALSMLSWLTKKGSPRKQKKAKQEILPTWMAEGFSDLKKSGELPHTVTGDFGKRTFRRLGNRKDAIAVEVKGGRVVEIGVLSKEKPRRFVYGPDEGVEEYHSKLFHVRSTPIEGVLEGSPGSVLDGVETVLETMGMTHGKVRLGEREFIGTERKDGRPFFYLGVNDENQVEHLIGHETRGGNAGRSIRRYRLESVSNLLFPRFELNSQLKYFNRFLSDIEKENPLTELTPTEREMLGIGYGGENSSAKR